MAFGLGVLRLSPEQFWSMTPREIAAALDGLLGRDRTTATPPTRHDLAALAARFPDGEAIPSNFRHARRHVPADARRRPS